MWAIIRATARPTSGRRPGLVVVAAGEVLVAQDGRAGDGRERDVLGREARARADDDAGVQVVGVVERPLQHLHAAERAADRRRAAARCRGGAASARCTRTRSETVNSGKRSPYGLPRGRVDRHRAGRAAAAAEQVGGDDEAGWSVSSGLPGPIRLSHQPGRARVAVVPGRVGVAGQGVADEDRVGAVGVELAVRLVGDLDRRQRRRRSRARSGSSSVKRTTRWVSTRPMEPLMPCPRGGRSSPAAGSPCVVPPASRRRSSGNVAGRQRATRALPAPARASLAAANPIGVGGP